MQEFRGLIDLKDHDPDLYDLIEQEKSRQWRSLELIASECSLRGHSHRIFLTTTNALIFRYDFRQERWPIQVEGN